MASPIPGALPWVAGSPFRPVWILPPRMLLYPRGASPGYPRCPGVDLVGHDGGQAVGDFNWTLTVTDRSTGWTEGGAVRTKAEIYVVAALESCLRRYPGLVIPLHADNGSEFMNGHLVRFCRALGITLTPEPFCPIPPRMFLYPRGVLGGGALLRRRESNSCRPSVSWMYRRGC